MVVPGNLDTLSSGGRGERGQHKSKRLTFRLISVALHVHDRYFYSDLSELTL